MVIGTLLCWSAFGIVVTTIDPFETDRLGFALFYVTLFFGLVGTVSLAALALFPRWSSIDLPSFRWVQKSFRVGIVSSAMLVFLLFLQIKQLLNWWNLIAFAAVLLLLFLFHLSTRWYDRRT